MALVCVLVLSLQRMTPATRAARPGVLQCFAALGQAAETSYEAGKEYSMEVSTPGIDTSGFKPHQLANAGRRVPPSSSHSCVGGRGKCAGSDEGRFFQRMLSCDICRAESSL